MCILSPFVYSSRIIRSWTVRAKIFYQYGPDIMHSHRSKASSIWSSVTFVLTFAEGLRCVSFIYPDLYQFWCTEIWDWIYWFGPIELAFTWRWKQSPVYKTLFKKSRQWTSKNSIIVIKTSVCVTVTPFLLACTTSRR
jgi:hypothetical protein